MPRRPRAVLTAAAGPPLVDAQANGAPAPLPTRRTLLLAAGLLLIAFNMRAAVASVGPVLRDIISATGLSVGGASLLTTIPSLCFSLAALVAAACARRLGIERAIAAAVFLLTAGLVIRGLGGIAPLFAGQIVATAGIGVVNVLLPGLVKRDFRGQAAMITGLYTMAFCLGAAISAGATVPLAHLADGWDGALQLWAIPAGLAAIAWTLLLPRRPANHAQAANTQASRRAGQGLWRDGLAWQVTLYMGLQSALAYIVFGWLAPILRDRGLNPVDAGLVMSVSVIAQAVGALGAPPLAVRRRSQSLANLLAVSLCLIGLMGCLYAPLATVWLWSVVLGLAQGALIALALTIIVLRSPNPQVAAELSGMAQGVGYLIASAGPLAAGLLHGWTGGVGGVAALSLVLGLLAGWFGWTSGRDRQVATQQARR